MDAPDDIDLSIKFNIPRSPNVYDGRKHKFKCLCCGRGFPTQPLAFSKSSSPLFQSNNGFLPWCKDCAELLYTQLVAFFKGNDAKAIKRYCQMADWVYDINPIVASVESHNQQKDRSMISHYAARKNINVGGRKTYTDTLKHRYENKKNEIIVSKEQVKSEEISVSASAVDRWGVGFAEMDYKNLDEHYRMLKKNNPNADSNQEIFIKTLCNLNMLAIKALQSGKSKEYASLMEQYSKTFNQAGLKTIIEKDNSNNECLGVTLATISQYTPEEYYKDKKLFSDFDDIGDYYDRHILRPMRNLMCDDDVRDKEFYVHEEDDNGEEQLSD